MKMCEVKALMYENVLLIDVGTAVLHYSGTMTGGFRFGLCAEVDREAAELLEEMETRRWRGWRERTLGGPVPRRPSRRPSRQNGYTFASPPRSPVYASQPILAQFGNPQALGTTRKDGARPATGDSAHNTTAHLRTSHLSRRERVPPTTAAAGYWCEYGYGRRPDARNPACVLEPPGRPHRLCSISGGPAVARTVHAPRIHTTQLCLCKPLHAPVVPESVCLIRCIDDRECSSPRSRCKCQYRWAWILPSSFSCCTCPFHPAAAAPCLELARAVLEQHAVGLLRGPGAQGVVPKDLDPPCPACRCTQRSMRQQRELDWTRSSATAVDHRAA